MANRDAQPMWLHDQNEQVTVLPYTTLDVIKIRNNGETNINNITQSFESVFYDQVNNLEGLREDLNSEVNSLQSQIDNINLTQDLATTTADGLMSKEDKALLDSLAEASDVADVGPATRNRLGKIIVGDTLTIDGNGVLNALDQEKALGDLTNVNITNVADGQLLAYDNTSGKWININSAAGIDNLSDIDDVTISNPINSQVLKYVVTNEGNYWTNGNVDFTTATLNSFTDVTITTPQNGDHLVYDSTTSKWINTSASSSVSDLDDLTNVDIDSSTLANGQVLSYDSTNSKWVNSAATGGGSSNVADLEDLTNVNISNPADGEVLKYDATNDEWVNDTDAGNGDGNILIGSDNYLVSSTDRSYNMTYNSNTKPSNLSVDEDSGEITIDVSGSNGDFDYEICEFSANGDFFENYIKNKKFAFMAEIEESTFCSFYLYNTNGGDYIILDEDNPFFIIEFEEDTIRHYQFFVKLDTTGVISVGSYTVKFTPKLIPIDDKYIKIGDGLKLKNGVLNTDTLDYDETMAALGTPTSSYIDSQNQLKSFTYTGDGATTVEITFSETPTIIMGIVPDAAYQSYKGSVTPFVWGSICTYIYWCTTAGGDKGGEVTFLSYNNNVLSFSSSNAFRCCNASGINYTVYYI